MCKISLLLHPNILHISEEGGGAPPPRIPCKVFTDLERGGGEGALTKTEPENTIFFLADPGKVGGYSTNTFVTHELIDSVILSLKYLYGAATS